MRPVVWTAKTKGRMYVWDGPEEGFVPFIGIAGIRRGRTYMSDCVFSRAEAGVMF